MAVLESCRVNRSDGALMAGVVPPTMKSCEPADCIVALVPL